VERLVIPDTRCNTSAELCVINLDNFISSTEEVMFYPQFVCLFVCLSVCLSVFTTDVSLTRKLPISFESRPDLDPDLRFF